MKRFKTALAFGVLAALSVLVISRYLLAVQSGTRAEQSSSCAALQAQAFEAPAPTFHLPDLQGRERSLEEFRGKTVLLNFWFTGCKPCIDELPSLVELVRHMAGREFALITVSIDESADEVKQFLKKHGIAERDLPVLLDPSKKVPESYGTSKFPESFLIDPQGVVRQKFIYKRNWAGATALSCIGGLLP